jgi:AMP-binding enzyme
VIVSWTIGGLLRDLTARGQHPAVISFGEDGIVTWASETVAEKALALVGRLRANGAGRGSGVALWAPNSPAWIVAALAVLAAGGALMLVDDLADAEQFEAALISSGAQLILTTTSHLEAEGAVMRAHGVGAIRIDDAERGAPSAEDGPGLAKQQVDDLTLPSDNDPAILTWTSGTTGSPKAFLLTHRNIAVNVEALQQLALVGPRDRGAAAAAVAPRLSADLRHVDHIDARNRNRSAARHDRPAIDKSIAGRSSHYDHRRAPPLRSPNGGDPIPRPGPQWTDAPGMSGAIAVSVHCRAVGQTSSGTSPVRPHSAPNCAAPAVAGLGRSTVGKGDRGID